MVVVLDEAANLCRIADLPQLYSHAGFLLVGSASTTPTSLMTCPG